MPMTARPPHAPKGHARRLLSRFLRGRAGNVAVTFALAGLPILLFTGAVIDYGFATRLQTKLQAATDATVLTLCQTPNETPTLKLQMLAVLLMNGYMGTNSGITVDPLVATSNPRKLTLTTHMPSQSFFPRVTGISATVVKGKSQCATPTPATFEIALVLDNTGSMNNSSNGQSKLQAAQKAAKNFIDYVKTNGAFSQDTRLSVVPFAAAVAVDPNTSRNAWWVDTQGRSRFHWANIHEGEARLLGFSSRLSIFDQLQRAAPPGANWGWAGCFEELPYPQSVLDQPPTHPDTLFIPLFAPDEPGDATSSCWSTAKGSDAKDGYGRCDRGAQRLPNSYLDDGDNSPNCQRNPPPTPYNYNRAEIQACKYKSVPHPNPNTYGPNMSCTTKPLQRLTTDATALKSLIDAMRPNGSTNIFEGVMWGWRTLSPNSVFADGAAYSSSTKKILVLMTDGTNTWPGAAGTTNGSFYFSFGYLNNADHSDPAPRLPPGYQHPGSSSQAWRAAIDELTRQACTNAKAAGVSVYTVGFSIPSDPIDDTGKQMLRDCASSANQAFIANDSNALISAFDQIAQSIGALRITE